MLRFLASILISLALAVAPARAQLMVSELNGFNAGGVELPSLTFIGCTVDITAATTYTFTSVDVGTAGNRTVIVAVMGRDTAGTFNGNSVTVGGSGATAQVLSNTAQLTNGEFWTISYPSGTSATIAVTWSEAVTSTVICVWDAKNLNSISAYDTAIASSGSSAALTLDTDVPAEGIIVGACTNTNTSAVATWTGLTERADASTGSNHAYSAADYTATTAQAPLGITCDQTTGGGSVGVVASFR